MGIYIEGFKMPESGYRTIEIAYDADGYPMAIADGGDVFDVIPIPPHGDLIDRYDLKNKEITIDYDEWDNTFDDGLLFVADLIDNAPTIIPAEESIDIQKEFMQNWHEEDSE